MNNAVKNIAAVAAFAFSAGAAFAQTPPPAPAHHGILSRLFHPKPKPGVYQSNGSAMHPMSGHAMTGSHSLMGGQFIGNKKSHVFHMPGDKGSLPAPQNRVYFSSAAAAQAAGYHASGSAHSAMSHNTVSHKAMMHGSTMMHH